MIFLIALIIIFADKRLGYMRKISVSKVGILLYSTNKRIILTTIVLGLTLIILYGFTFPFDLNNSFSKILYYSFGGIILALGYSQEKINKIKAID